MPPGVRVVLNAGLDRWAHLVPIDREDEYRNAPAVYEAATRARLAEVIRQHYLTVDEHPTYSRMFTFASNVNKLLGLIILGLVDKVLRLVVVTPQKRTRGAWSRPAPSRSSRRRSNT